MAKFKADRAIMDREITLKDFSREINAESIECDFGRRKLKIYDADKNLISVIVFSATVPELFNIEDILYRNTSSGELEYFVYQNGYDNRYWLYCFRVGDSSLNIAY
jgi:hypothetical protein